MGIFSKDIKTMDDLFVHQLKDIYYAEKRILAQLPRMSEKTTDPALRQNFDAQTQATRENIGRLEQVFALHGAALDTLKCPAIDGLIDEAEQVASDVADQTVVDAALLAAAQAMEYYEISRYRSLLTWAKMLRRNECARLLKENLEEDVAAEALLTSLAEYPVNFTLQ